MRQGVAPVLRFGAPREACARRRGGADRRRRTRAARAKTEGQAARRPVGVSWRQDRDGRRARGRAHPRTHGRAWDHGQSGLPRAPDLRQPRLRRFPPLDAAFYLSPLARLRPAARRAGIEMGAAERSEILPDATGGLAVASASRRVAWVAAAIEDPPSRLCIRRRIRTVIS